MRIMSWFLTLCFLGFSLVGAQAHAVPVESLYEAVVPVPDTSESERAPAFSRALEKVLVRVSGSPEVLEREGVEDILGNAANLVQAYRYQQSSGEGGASDALQLAVSFGAVGVTRALAEIDAPVWGANRPAVLAWVAAQSRSGRTLATNSPDSDWGAVMEQAAKDKGIPLVLPSFDEVDRAAVSLSDIWGLFISPIEAASERYRGDILGVARISGATGNYTARWALRGAGTGLDGEVQGDSPQSIADAITGAWAKALSARYAVTPGTEGTSQVVDLVVSDVQTLETYAEIRRSLAAMEPVSEAAPVRVLGDKLRLRLAFNGELDLLQEHLALERRLIKAEPETRAHARRSIQAGQAQSELAAPKAPSNITTVGTGKTDDSLRDPTIRPIPGAGEAVIPVDGQFSAQNGVQEDDFKSLYPVLYFKWAEADERTQAPASARPEQLD